MKQSKQSKLNIISGGRHFSFFLYSLITTARILYPYTSLPVFCTTEIGSKRIFQNKETSSTKTTTKRSQCWDISKLPSWTESLNGKFQARMDPSFPLLFFFILFSHLCLPHAFSPPCIYLQPSSPECKIWQAVSCRDTAVQDGSLGTVWPLRSSHGLQ